MSPSKKRKHGYSEVKEDSDDTAEAVIGESGYCLASKVITLLETKGSIGHFWKVIKPKSITVQKNDALTTLLTDAVLEGNANGKRLLDDFQEKKVEAEDKTDATTQQVLDC